MWSSEVLINIFVELGYCQPLENFWEDSQLWRICPPGKISHGTLGRKNEIDLGSTQANSRSEDLHLQERMSNAALD